MPLCSVKNFLVSWTAGGLCLALCALYCCRVYKLRVGTSEILEAGPGVLARHYFDTRLQEDQLPYSSDGACVRLCYYVLPQSNTSDYLQPEDVDPFLCSHLVLVAEGTRIVNDTIQLGRPTDVQMIKRAVLLKVHNPKLRLMFSLMLGFPQLVHNNTAMISFAYKARMFLEQHELDGLDLDWEFPAWSPDPQTGEKGLFVVLLDKLSTALRLVQPSYLISVAVTGIQPILDHSYDIPGIAGNSDFISLMGYDYHMYKSYLPFTGHNAPLFPHHNARGYFRSLNVNASVAALEERGLPRSKLLVGVPTYGRTWRLASAQYQNLGALAVDEGFGGGYISYPGAWAFTRSATVVIMDKEAVVPYAARDKDWISYENLQSITAKAKFIQDAGVAGAMTFHLGTDDWAGVTGSRFPLHSAVSRVLASSSCCCLVAPGTSRPQARTDASDRDSDIMLKLSGDGAHPGGPTHEGSFNRAPSGLRYGSPAHLGDGTEDNGTFGASSTSLNTDFLFAHMNGGLKDNSGSVNFGVMSSNKLSLIAEISRKGKLDDFIFSDTKYGHHVSFNNKVAFRSPLNTTYTAQLKLLNENMTSSARGQDSSKFRSGNDIPHLSRPDVLVMELPAPEEDHSSSDDAHDWTHAQKV